MVSYQEKNEKASSELLQNVSHSDRSFFQLWKNASLISFSSTFLSNFKLSSRLTRNTLRARSAQNIAYLKFSSIRRPLLPRLRNPSWVTSTEESFLATPTLVVSHYRMQQLWVLSIFFLALQTGSPGIRSRYAPETCSEPRNFRIPTKFYRWHHSSPNICCSNFWVLLWVLPFRVFLEPLCECL